MLFWLTFFFVSFSSLLHSKHSCNVLSWFPAYLIAQIVAFCLLAFVLCCLLSSFLLSCFHTYVHSCRLLACFHAFLTVHPLTLLSWFQAFLQLADLLYSFHVCLLSCSLLSCLLVGLLCDYTRLKKTARRSKCRDYCVLTQSLNCLI